MANLINELAQAIDTSQHKAEWGQEISRAMFALMKGTASPQDSE